MQVKRCTSSNIDAPAHQGTSAQNSQVIVTDSIAALRRTDGLGQGTRAEVATDGRRPHQK
jgi:hypothetical protein